MAMVGVSCISLPRRQPIGGKVITLIVVVVMIYLMLKGNIDTCTKNK